MKWILFLLSGTVLLAQTAPIVVTETKGAPSGLAAGMLAETQLARQAIASQDGPAAMTHVDQALANAMAARDRVTAEGKSVNVPVDMTLDETVLYAPVKHHKGVLTAQRLKRGTNVREVSGELTRDTVNVAAAYDHLLAAQTALTSGNLAAADAALAAVQGSVAHRTTVQTDMPLLRVRENLLLARNRALDSNYKAAEAPLKSAADALAEYARMNPGPHGNSALALRGEMEDYAHRVGHEHADAVDRINAWLDTTNTWFKEMTE